MLFTFDFQLSNEGGVGLHQFLMIRFIAAILSFMYSYLFNSNVRSDGDVPTIIHFGSSACLTWKMFMIEIIISCQNAISNGQKKNTCK